MLRVTQQDGRNGAPGVVIVEGAISGPWVDELRRFMEALGNQPFSLDLSRVGYVDAQGLLLLKELADRSTEVVQSSPYVAALLDKGGRS